MYFNLGVLTARASSYVSKYYTAANGIRVSKGRTKEEKKFDASLKIWNDELNRFLTAHEETISLPDLSEEDIAREKLVKEKW